MAEQKENNTGHPPSPPERAAAEGEAELHLELSNDSMEAYLTIQPVGDSVHVVPERIRQELHLKGITFGLREELLSDPARLRPSDRIPIASGVLPVEGEDGRLEYLLPIERPGRVSMNDRLARIIPPKPGRAGTDVLGRSVPPQEPLPARLPKLFNVSPDPSDESFLVAQVDGYMTADPVELRVTPFFVLEPGEDEFEASVRVQRPLAPGDYSESDLREFLRDHGVVFGLREEGIREIFDQGMYGQDVLIAEGVPPVDGKDGVLHYFFETEVLPRVDEDGNVDYKNISLIHNVRKGDPLVEAIAPIPGKEGCTVYGRKSQPRNGTAVNLTAGKNMEFDPERSNLIVAGIDGCVRLRGKNLELEPVFAVKDDVDYTTGNIDFVGSVKVGKTVLSGFRVAARKDVEVGGVVEDALVESGGDVMIKFGFTGRGKGTIRARGQVHALFCENETIEAEGDIVIADYIMNSKVSTAGMLSVVGKNGVIVGGLTVAARGVEAKTLGNRNYLPTHVIAGVNKKLSEESEKLKEHVALLTDKIDRIAVVIRKYKQAKLLKCEIDKQQEQQVFLLARLKKEKEEDRIELNHQIEKLNERLQEYRQAKVKVFGAVYPGVTVTIFDRSLKLTEAFKAVCFQYGEDAVLAVPLVAGKEESEMDAIFKPAPEGKEPQRAQEGNSTA
ncbi:FapA family protein [bacterium]|nr:FapA family protein [bacterium]